MNESVSDCRRGKDRNAAQRHPGARDNGAALRRTEDYVRACEVVMACYAGTFVKLEAAFVFVAHELPRDPVVYEFFVLTPSGTFSPEIFAVANHTLGPILEAGRQRQEVRTDISTSNVLRWLIEQLYLTLLDPNHTKAHVISRVRTFVVPALSARPADAMAGSVSSHLETLNGALAQALDTVSALRTVLPDPHRA